MYVKVILEILAMINVLKMVLVLLDIQMKALIPHIKLGLQRINLIVEIYLATLQLKI